MNTDTLTTTDDRHPLMERVELINHLLKFSDRLFTIMSADARELDTFANMLMREGRIGLRFAKVAPDMALTAEDVAADLAKAWGIQVSFGESASQAIEQRLPGLIPEPRRAVAMIDDVERLPRSALNDLIAFMQRMDSITEGRVRLILMGGPSLANQLQGLKSLSEGGQVYALHLSGASSQTPHDESVSSDDKHDEQEHFKPSLESASAPDEQHTGLPGRTLLIAGLALSLVLAIAMALLLRPSEPEAPKDQHVSIPLQDTKPETASVTPTPAPDAPATQAGHDIAATVATAPAAPVSEVVVTEPVKEAPAPVPPTPAAPATTPASSEPGLTQETKAPVPETVAKETPGEAFAKKLMAEDEPPKTPAAAPAKPQTLPAAKLAVVESGKPVKAAGNWFASQPGKNYVVQVISLRSAKDIERFSRNHDLKDCHEFTQTRDGQTLHTLTCGLYGNREEAMKAIAQLPEKVRAGAPYPRKVEDVRKVMHP